MIEVIQTTTMKLSSVENKWRHMIAAGKDPEKSRRELQKKLGNLIVSACPAFPTINQRPRSANMWLEIAKGVDAPYGTGGSCEVGMWWWA